MPSACASSLARRAALRPRLAALAAGATFSARGLVPLLAAPRAALLAAAGLFVDGGPGAALGLFLTDAAALVAFLDVGRLALLFSAVRGLVAARHGCLTPPGREARKLHGARAS